MILDFSDENFVLPLASEKWQESILDFVKSYRKQSVFKVPTSGSTGKPKQIEISKGNMQLSAKNTIDFLGLKKGDVALLCLPAEYIAGKMMIVRSIERGMCLLCVRPASKVSIDEAVDFCAMTPMQAEESIENLDKIKSLILGGATVSIRLENKLKKRNTQIFETYGMTETITHIAMRKLNAENSFSLLTGFEINSDSNACLQIRTPYFSEKIKTNDIVEILSDTTFRVLGRVDNVINSGGLKIFPEKWEKLLQPYISLPFVIHYKKDDKLGQKVVLVVEGTGTEKVEIPDGLIPKNQRPKEIVFVKKLPRTATNKIKRTAIF